jgi:enterochelin esterase-like enzyme
MGVVKSCLFLFEPEAMMKTPCFFVALCVLLCGIPAVAANLEGRYRGHVDGARKNGQVAQHDVFLTIQSKGDTIECSASLNSFDDQHPCMDVVWNNGVLSADIPDWGDVLFTLHEGGDRMAGPLTLKSGEPADPYQSMDVARIGDLELADIVPRLPGEGTDRSPRLLKVRAAIAGGDPAALGQFWREVAESGAPLVEPVANSGDAYLVTFLWRGDAQTTSVLVYWRRFALANPDDYLMLHVSGSDIWFKTIRFRRGTRIYYQLSPNDPLQQRPAAPWSRKAQADPLNPKRDPEGPELPAQRVRSLLELPGALPQPWYTKRPDAPHFTVAESTLPSVALKSNRKITVYLPPNYSSDHRPYGSIYLFDGEDPDGYVFATWTFENLLQDGKIPPVVIVRVSNPDQATRQHDLECNDNYTRFLTDELVPYIRTNYHVTADPAQTLIGGYSLGGLAAMYAAFRHPEIFGLVLSQSGSFWYEPTGSEFAEPNWLAREFAKSKLLPLRFYVDAGVYEVDFSGEGGNVLIPNRELRDVLRSKGYSVTYVEFAGEHDPINWRGLLADGLIALLGSDGALSNH